MFFTRLIAREAAGQLRSRRVRIGTALAIALAALTVVIRVDDYRNRTEDARRQREYVRELRDDQHSRLSSQSSSAAEIGVDAQLRTVRAPSPGSVLVRGLDGTMPTHWDFSAWTTISGPPPGSTSRVSEIGAMFDVEAIVRLLLGLLAIAAGLDGVISARHEGALAALSSQSVTRITIAVGMLIGNALALLASLAAVLLAVAGTLWLRASGLMTPGMAASIAAFGAISCVFLTTMVAIGMAIGSLARAEAVGVTIAMTTWVVSCLASPELILVLPRVFITVPARATLEDGLGVTYTQRIRTLEFEMGTELLKLAPPQFNWTRGANEPPALAIPVNGLWMQQIAVLRDGLDRREAEWSRAASRSDVATEWLARLNPATAFLQSAMAATDTGYALRERWQEATTRYERRLIPVLYDTPYRFSITLPTRGVGRLVKDLPPVALAQVGEVADPGLPWRGRLARARWDLAALVLFLIGSSVWTVAVFPRPGF